MAFLSHVCVVVCVHESDDGDVTTRRGPDKRTRETRDERTARESVQPRKASRSRERESERVRTEETASVVFKTFEGRWVKKMKKIKCSQL